MLAHGQSSSAKRWGLAVVSSGLIFLKRKNGRIIFVFGVFFPFSLMLYLSICYPILVLSTYLSPYSVLCDPFLLLFFSGMRAFLRISCWGACISWLWAPLAYVCLGKFLFIHRIWRIVSLDRVFLAESFCPSKVWICHSTLSYPVRFLQRSLLKAW